MASSCEPLVMHAGSSAAHPSDGFRDGGKNMSRSQKRRGRLRRTAALKSRESSSGLMAVLDIQSSQGIPSRNSPGAESLLCQAIGKIDNILSLLQQLCFPSASQSLSSMLPVPAEQQHQPMWYGLPGEFLQRQCDAVRVLQRAWRQRQSNYATEPQCKSSPAVSQGMQDGTVTKDMCARCWEVLPTSPVCAAVHFCKVCAIKLDLRRNREVSGQIQVLGAAPSDADKGPKQEGNGGEQLPRFGNIMMRSVISMVVKELSQSSRWRDLPEKIMRETVEKLSQPYEGSSGNLYTETDVQDLMQRTGLACGQVCAEWRSSARASEGSTGV